MYGKILSQSLIQRAKQLRLDVLKRDSGDQDSHLITHIPTGFTIIDDTYGGIRRGVATLLLAHTGDGKSAFARNCAEGAARRRAGVLWFCGEDPEEATCERFFADSNTATSTDIGALHLSPAQLNLVDKASVDSVEWASRIQVIYEAPSIDDVVRIVTDTRKVGDVDLGLVILDYAQIFGDSHNLEGEIARLATSLNNLSGDRKLATMILSQVSTDVYRRGSEMWANQHNIAGFIPRLGDTEWCKRAEKSCKAVWSLFRPGRWKREMGEECEDDTAEFHVKKASFGPTGWQTLGWDGPKVRFFNIGE